MDGLYTSVLGFYFKAPYGKALAKGILTWTAYAARLQNIHRHHNALHFHLKDDMQVLKV